MLFVDFPEQKKCQMASIRNEEGIISAMILGGKRLGRNTELILGNRVDNLGKVGKYLELNRWLKRIGKNGIKIEIDL